jgi:sulfur-carrier protein
MPALTATPNTNAATVTVTFAPHLQRHVPCPAQRVVANTLAEALNKAFVAAPALRSYVLDDQGHIRKHVAVFINSELIRNRNDLSIAVNDHDKIDVIQALSGG